MSFPKRIAYHVKLGFTNSIYPVAVVLDDYLFPLLDLTDYSYNVCYNQGEARHYVGVQICNFLKNKSSKESLLNDYWMNEYLGKTQVLKILRTVTVVVAEISGR